jgi:holo-[acyl-carrier protein] synthase
MINGIGIDLIEVARIAQVMQRTPRFIARVFSPTEREYCQRQALPAQHYAARFAAKEAFFKALGTGYREGLSFSEISIEVNPLGKPTMLLRGKTAEIAHQKGCEAIHLSLSHTADYACAVVLIEKLN